MAANCAASNSFIKLMWFEETLVLSNLNSKQDEAVEWNLNQCSFWGSKQTLFNQSNRQWLSIFNAMIRTVQ